MGSDIVVPVAFLAMIVALVAIPNWLKSRDRREMQTTLRAAIEKGQPIPTDVVEAMSAQIHRAPSANRDLRLGVILLSVAVGVSLCGGALWFIAEEAFYSMLAASAVPAAIGVAFIGLSFFNKNKD